MRECLGWITNCENKQGCPQNWLELSVSEIPTEVRCHVCEASVSLVTSEDDLFAKDSQQSLAAFPVVPCTGVVGIQRAATAHHGGGGGGGGGGSAVPAGNPRASGNGAPEKRARPAPVEPVAKIWFCTLQNGESIKMDK